MRRVNMLLSAAGLLGALSSHVLFAQAQTPAVEVETIEPAPAVEEKRDSVAEAVTELVAAETGVASDVESDAQSERDLAGDVRVSPSSKGSGMMSSLRDIVTAPFSVSGLFDDYKAGIYQIRTINQATGQKTSIGSGFIVGEGDMIATNYHVVSDAVQKENRVLRYVDMNDQEGELTLLGVDVVHDLALLKADKKLGNPFGFAPIPPQGAPLYALGNPHDLGFIIVDGINNGLLKKSARERILFSGALNSGMSGGPTLDQEGNVVGVNVSYLSQGNDISFIIPSQYLEELISAAARGENDLNTAIARQLFDDNVGYYGDALHEQWPDTTIGHFKVPLAMRDDVRCWDSSPDPDVDDLLGMEAVTCFSDRSTFISDDVTLGQMGYSYSYFYPREDMPTLRFYRLYSHFYYTNMELRPQRDYDDVECDSDFVDIAGRMFRTTLCTQPSKKFIIDGEPIEDIRLIAAEIGESAQGFIFEIGLNGVQDGLGRQIIAHMLKQITWVD